MIHPRISREHVETILRTVQKTIHPLRAPLTSLEVAGPVGRISYKESRSLKPYRSAKIGDVFGPHWATFWFRCEAVVPKSFAGRRVELVWDSTSEATLWINGKTAQGLNQHNWGPRKHALLSRSARAGERFRFDVEMACNNKFGISQNDGRAASSTYELVTAEIAVRDELAWQIYHDLLVLCELEKEHDRGLDPAWAGRLLAGLNSFATQYDANDRDTWKPAHAHLKPLLTVRNGQVVHELHAIGHAHIDTAWLWPLAETWRKCERTFSSAVAYMDEYPEYRFACSQAYQYDVIRRRNPDLYKRIKERFKRKQWIPVGGTWIEPDCNLPSGESLCRQFLFGQRFFEREFGLRCKEFWNPDVFGYAGQLPQIMAQAGIRRFLTQKLSWNSFTKPLHHTFDWEGIDGTRVLAHFPPADTYNANCTVREIRHSVSNYKDNAGSARSYYLFGWGDGGGGPTTEMLERLRRMRDLQGLPRVVMTDSDSFFSALENEPVTRPVVVGELYFELHRGTYTTQAHAKRGNRKSEQLIHDVEFLAVATSLQRGKRYPRKQINAIWEIILLNQFHDILPGSSISLVYEDTRRHYAQIASEANALIDESIGHLSRGDSKARPLNCSPVDQTAVISVGRTLKLASANAYSTGDFIEPTDSVSYTTKGNFHILDNAAVRATFDRNGRMTSLIEKSSGRESLAGPANLLQLFHDRPNHWEAWDVDPTYIESLIREPAASRIEMITHQPLRVELKATYALSDSSTLEQIIRLDAHSRRVEFHCRVNWNESAKLLRVAFPVNVRATHATYEMQFGHVQRPTHFNTMADRAQFEVPFHKWFDLSEHGFGVSILSESKYGASTLGNVMGISLLRSPKSPDPNADIHEHEFAYAIYPHAGRWEDSHTVAEGFAFNQPMRAYPQLGQVNPPARSLDRNLILDTIKCAEDDDDIILRFYECHGSRGTANIELGFDAASARHVNTLEDDLGPLQLSGRRIIVPYRPFEIVSIRIRRTG